MNPTTAPRESQPSPFPGTGKLLGLDVGLTRIGVAVCDPLQLAARPLRTLERASRNEDFALLAQIVDQEEIIGIACGLPLNMDGSSGPQAKTTRKWAMRLAHALRALLGRSIPIAMCDERLSTFAAQQLAGYWPDGVGEDAVAAAVILQSLLDAQHRTRTGSGQEAAQQTRSGEAVQEENAGGALDEPDEPKDDRKSVHWTAHKSVHEVIQLPPSSSKQTQKRQQEE